ncbi:hypothetical protein CIPAW_02G049900 [Carya illinoinensis]|uniref:Retrovirus-related Pol polyprotein from transposon TNT 1-94-like beta-barrel domain-containing protein n=1 Tax=Carya illinoinensis TaxID=32201 RepID=A0A8T1RB08_CARIL|nr:hypothetical protein CIPAW_02G049900 [Carya illinoinensis]
MCFPCGGPNHKADSCCATDEETESYQAFLAIQTGDALDDVWYPDTGPNQHMAPTSTDAKGILPYSGTNSVIVGNSLGLPISGVSNFEVPHTSLTIKNALIVPTLKKRLLSVSQFTTDRICCLVFYPWGFLIKDLKTSQ